jgi:HEAT repeat protein
VKAQRAALFAIVLAGACAGPRPAAERRPEDQGAVVAVSELPERHRELLEAYGKGGSVWEDARRRALADPELARFLVDNLVIELVRAWHGQNAAEPGRARRAFERARAELVRSGTVAAPVLAQLLDVGDAVVAELAANVLLRIDPAPVAEMAELLGSPEGETRRRAAALLARLGANAEADGRAHEALERLAHADPEWTVRAEAAAALGVRGARERSSTPARKALERALADPDPAVAAVAAKALQRLDDPRAIPALKQALERAAARGDLRVLRAVEEALEALSAG